MMRAANINTRLHLPTGLTPTLALAFSVSMVAVLYWG